MAVSSPSLSESPWALSGLRLAFVAVVFLLWRGAGASQASGLQLNHAPWLFVCLFGIYVLSGVFGCLFVWRGVLFHFVAL